VFADPRRPPAIKTDQVLNNLPSSLVFGSPHACTDYKDTNGQY
jgi:hypothetical protein